jgi:transposase
MPYSLDLRKRIVAAVNNGMTKSKACLTFNICRQTIYNWLVLEKSEGHLKDKQAFKKVIVMALKI